MCTNHYEWVEYVEKEYQNLIKNRIGGLQAWFQNIKELPQVQKDVARISGLKFKGKSQNAEEDVILTAWAQMLYHEYYDSKDDVVIKNEYHLDGYFNVTGRYGKILREYWKGNSKTPIQIPTLQESKDRHYWVEICLAMQKRYCVFKSLSDLNKFVYIVGESTEIGNYGLYLRDINQVCLAYAILHGYSLDDEKGLLEKATEIIKAYREKVTPKVVNANNTYTAIANDAFYRYFIVDEQTVGIGVADHTSEQAFLNSIRENAHLFIGNCSGNNNAFDHWSALKNVLLAVINVSDDKRDNIFDNIDDIRSKRGFKQRLVELYGYVSDMIDDNVEADDGLRLYIKNQLGIEKMYGVSSIESIQAAEYAQKIINKSLRYICIFAIMKDLYNGKTCESAVAAIEEINDRLGKIVSDDPDLSSAKTSVGFREIEYQADGQGTLYVDNPRDIFDWFVVHALNLEEIEGGDYISGYEAFMNYVFFNEY